MRKLKYISVAVLLLFYPHFAVAANLHKKDISEVIEENAIVVVTTKSNHLKLRAVNLEDSKFEKYQMGFHDTRTKKLNKKFGNTDAHENKFYVRYLPPGKYAYTESVYVYYQRNKLYNQSKCQSNGAPVFDFQAGNIYYFRAPDKFLNPEVEKKAIENGFPGYSLSEADAINWLGGYFEQELGRKEIVKLAKDVGTIKFDGAVKRGLGFGIGAKSIKCPHGKEFVFSTIK